MQRPFKNYIKSLSVECKHRKSPNYEMVAGMNKINTMMAMHSKAEDFHARI